MPPVKGISTAPKHWLRRAPIKTCRTPMGSAPMVTAIANVHYEAVQYLAER